MPEFGYASKYNPVGWKATIPESPDIVDAIGCVGDVVVYFLFDDATQSFVCKQGMAKKPSQIWAAMPDGGSFNAHVPCIGYNELLGGGLRLRYLSGISYYPWLMQAGSGRYVNESVVPATVGVADPYSGFAVRLFDASSLVPATYTYLTNHYNDAGDPINSSYTLTLHATSPRLVVATASTTPITFESYETYTSGLWSPLSFTGLIQAGFTHFLVALTSYPFRGLAKWPADTPGLGAEGKTTEFILAVTVTTSDVSWQSPVDVTNEFTAWTPITYRGVTISSAEIRAYIGHDYVVVTDLEVGSVPGYGSAAFVPIEGNTGTLYVDLNNNITNITTNFFGRYGGSEWSSQNTHSNYGEFLIYGTGGFSIINYTWNPTISRWVSSAGASYPRGCEYVSFGPPKKKYGRFIVDFKDMISIDCQTSTLSNFSDLATSMPAGFFYFPHYGVGVFSGNSLHLYKDGDPSQYVGGPINMGSTAVWGFPQYVKYVDPESLDTLHRYSIRCQGGVCNITFNADLSTLVAISIKPFIIEYSDGTRDAMSRSWTALADITGGGMYSNDLVRAGATILDMY